MEIIRSIAQTGHKITDMSLQVRDQNRVNVFVDGKYAFSLDIAQVGELGVKVGLEVDDARLAELKTASEFGKVYQRALEYVLMRPRSVREVRDYLYKKTFDKRVRVVGRDGEYQTKVKKGVDKGVTEAVLARLIEKKYVDDEKFARFWVENRQVRKGISAKKLRLELAAKGVDRDVVDEVVGESMRDDKSEMMKIIEKKRARYDDEKLVAYLVRQGFDYYEVKAAVESKA